MKKLLSSVMKGNKKVNEFISIRYTLCFFGFMVALYLFSMFGSMLSSPAFTYAEF